MFEADGIVDTAVPAGGPEEGDIATAEALAAPDAATDFDRAALIIKSRAALHGDAKVVLERARI